MRMLRKMAMGAGIYTTFGSTGGAVYAGGEGGGESGRRRVGQVETEGGVLEESGEVGDSIVKIEDSFYRGDAEDAEKTKSQISDFKFQKKHAKDLSALSVSVRFNWDL